MQSRKYRQRLAMAAASASLLTAAGSVFATFTSIDTFKPTDPVGGPYSWDNTANWQSGTLPNAGTLVRMPLGPGGTVNSVPAGAIAYGFDINGDTGTTTFQQNFGTTLTVTSFDSVYDPATSLAPAFNTVAGANGNMTFRSAVQLGNGSVTSGTMYSITNGPSVIFDRVTQAPGTSIGMTFIGSGQTQARAASNSGNYITNRWDFTGKITVARNADLTNGRLFLFNSVLPYGPGLPNIQLDGTITHQHNSNQLILNAIDSEFDTALIQRSAQGGTEMAIGANGQNGSWAGRFNPSTNNPTTLDSLFKIGAGVQVFSNGTSNYGRTTLVEGVLSVNSIGDQGVVSALGTGTTTFDGGGLRYTGAGHTANRAIEIGFRGGTIEASGTGSLAYTGTVTATDTAWSVGDNTNTGPSQEVTNMFGINGLGALAAAGSLQITQQGTGISGANGTMPVSINETTRVLTLAAGATNNAPGNGAGQPRIVYTSTSPLARTFTLSGTNTGDNTIGGVLANSGSGGTLNINKTGPGKWVLSGANTYTGTTVVNGGSLQLNLAAHAPVLPGTATTSFADIRAGSLIFDYNGGSTVGPTVLGILKTGFNQPTKFSDGQIRSTTVTPIIGLGWKDDTTAMQVVVKRTFYGDADLDGDADGVDIGTWATNFTGELSGGPTATRVWTQGDWDYDGDVDGVDAGQWATAFTGELSGGGLGDVVVTTINPQASAILQGLGITVVPEPATLGIFGLLFPLSRRTRRR